MVQELLDDHTIKVQGMRGSAYAKPFQRTITDLEHFLESTQEIVDMWLKVQSHWLYLQPIMTAPDIARQLPAEGKAFGNVDNMWRNIMRQAAAAPACTQVVRIDRLLEQLTKAHGMLESTMHSLNAYLETKRLYFSRFFFLSNDELLEILAETKDPHRVQKHLSKCFEGISKLEFDDHLDIRAMYSKAGERLEFLPLPKAEGGRFINPKAAGSNVEVWLLQVEGSMRQAVSRNIDQAVGTFNTTQDRIEWVRRWSQQAVLAVSEVMWTTQISHAIRNGGPPSLRLYAQQLTQQLQVRHRAACPTPVAPAL